MVSEVYKDHGIFIRRITLDLGRGPGYEISSPSGELQITRAQFKKMVLTLVEHMMRAEG